MKKQYYTESASKFPRGHDLYYVHNLPNANASSSYRADEDLQREKLEGELYAKLQGHQGNLMPVIGNLLKYIVLAVLFPFYTLLYLGQGIKNRFLQIMARLKAIVLPYYNRLYATYSKLHNKITQIYARCASKGKGWEETISVWMKEQWKLRVIPIKEMILEKRAKLYDLISGHALRIGERSAALSKRVSRKVDDVLKQVIARLMAVKAKAVTQGKGWLTERYVKIFGRLKSIWNICRRIFMTTTAWVRVLSRYGMRVLEDWALEVKQHFSKRKK